MKKLFFIAGAILIAATAFVIIYSCSEKDEHVINNHVRPKPIFSHFNDVIGQIQGENYVVTCDEERLADNWNQVLSSQGITSDLTDFEIVYIESDTTYLLMGYDDAIDLSACIRLELENDYFYEANVADPGNNAGLTVTCQSSECFKPDCQPRIKGENGWCTFCLHECIQTTTRTGSAIY